MCKFFSFVHDTEKDLWMYCDWNQRLKFLDGTESGSPDSHTTISTLNGYTDKKEDVLDKYEYNPLLKELVIDQNNSGKASPIAAQAFIDGLDWSKIVPALIIKPIINPLHKEHTLENCKELLRKWASVYVSVYVSVCASVGDSVRASVKASVKASVWDSVYASVYASVEDSMRASMRAPVKAFVWDSVGASVWASVYASMCASVEDSMRASMRASVKASVWDSVGAYESSFYKLARKDWKRTAKIKCGDENPFNPCIQLFENGLVPSFDGKMWRLHAGKDAKIVYEITAEELGEVMINNATCPYCESE